MSLLKVGGQSVIVHTRVETIDRYGGAAWVEGPSYRVDHCSIQPVTAQESEKLGFSPNAVYRLICRSWPGGPASRIEWNGRMWDQHGETRIYTTGRRTQHVDVLLTPHGTEVT